MDIDIKCKQCEAEFKILKKEYTRQLKRGRRFFFCSLRCGAVYANSFRISEVVSKKCAYCAREFVTKQDRHEADYCSRSCASKGSVTSHRREKACEIGRSSGNLLTIEETLLKREYFKYALLELALIKRNVRHAFEYRIDDCVFDLALLDKQLLVEFDGPDHRYMHGLLRDAKHDAVAVENGWKVLRVPVEIGQVVSDSILDGVL